MQRITKEQYQDILFDPNIQVSEKRSNRRSTIRGKSIAVTKLVSPDGVLAVREITSDGGFYYRVVERPV